MNLRQLQYFVAVAEELHFTRAAERLAVSQPPLSQQIAALEDEIGVALFTRTNRTVALTPVGEQWLPAVRKVLEGAAGLPDLARRLGRGETGTLTIGFVSTAGYGLLPALLARYTAARPDVRLQLREATTDVQIEALLQRRLDVGIVIAPREAAQRAGLTCLPLGRERLMLALPAQWVDSGRAVLRRGKANLRELAHEPLILFPRSSAPALHDLILDHYASLGCQPRFGQEAVQMQTIISLVSAGLGMALVPQSLRNLQRPGTVYCGLSTRSPPGIETGLLWQPGRESPALSALVAMAGSWARGPQAPARHAGG